MRSIFRIFLLMFLASSLSACGVKGKLKTPDQIENQAEKEAKQAEDKKAKEAEALKDSSEKK